jgi:hypothetical protein
MKTNIPPAIIAASIAGGGIGTAAGFMTRGEELEDIGASGFQQLGGATVSGITHGVAGVGIGVGVAGTAIALKKILGK